MKKIYQDRNFDGWEGLKKKKAIHFICSFFLWDGVGLLMPYPPHANLTTVNPLYVFARIRQV